MSQKLYAARRFLIPSFVVLCPFAAASALTSNLSVIIFTAFIAVSAVAVYLKGFHRTVFNPSSKKQKALFAFATALLILFSFFLCAISIQAEWLHDYPLAGSVDDYGCYPQLFDAFQKGQLNIDTDYDLSIIEALDNPYNPSARKRATGETNGVFWDRAFYNGKLYSYFGVAPVILFYYPAYFLTGKVLSDALAAALQVSASCILLMMLFWELCKRMERKPPFLLVLLGGATLPFGALLFPTLTNANFYHIAVLSGIMSVCAFFLFVLKAESSRDGFKRKLLFALAGISAASIVASRPNMVIYTVIALPILFSVIKKRENGLKSLLLDIAAFAVPMVALGSLIMLYNHARFGSPFDFGTNYQLTVTDIEKNYHFTPALILPAFYHFFINPPEINGVFPYIHVAARKFADYGVDRYVYVAKTVGSFFFPATWGCFLLPVISRNKRRLLTGALALVSVIFLAVFDMCFGGTHLRYAADIMFILTVLGAYLLLVSVANLDQGSRLRTALYTASILLFLLTVSINFPLCLDNERDMIYKYHREIFNFFSFGFAV